MNLIDSFDTIERRIIKKASATSTPVNGSIELTPLCNMDCNMCYVRLNPKETAAHGRIHSADEWLAAAEQMRDAGVLFLLLTGGEPLLYPDFQALFTGLQDMGMILTVNTNATLFDKKWADFFSEHRPRRINITLYGASADNYEAVCHYRNGFDHVINALTMLKERDIDVRIGFSLTPENLNQLDEVREIAGKFDYPLNVDTYMVPSTRERSRPFNDHYRVLPETAAQITFYNRRAIMEPDTFHRHVSNILAGLEAPVSRVPRSGTRCLAGHSSFAVSWCGKLHPCVIFDQPEADLFELGFQAAWNNVSEKLKQFQLDTKCSECPKYTICPTCLASELYESGSFGKAPEYLCRYTDELVRLYREEHE